MFVCFAARVWPHTSCAASGAITQTQVSTLQRSEALVSLNKKVATYGEAIED